MDRQVAKRAVFLTMSTGRPGRYTGRDLCTAHAGLAGLTDEHVDRVIGHLTQTLRELGVARGRHRRRRGRRGQRPGRRAEPVSAMLLTFDGHGYRLRAGR